MRKQDNNRARSGIAAALTASLAAAALTLSVSAALAQGQGGGKSGGHDASTSHDSGHSSQDSGSKGKSGKGGSEAGRGKGGGHQSLRDVFKEMEDEARADTTSKGKGAKGKGASGDKGEGKIAPKSAASSTTKGKKPTKDVAEGFRQADVGRNQGVDR